MAVASSALPRQPATQPWYFHPAIDWLGLGGLTFVLVVFFILWNTARLDLTWVATATLIGSVLVNYPHYAATYYRVYRRWGDVKQYALETLWIPVLLIGIGALCLLNPANKALSSWYCAGYLFFAGWHYSGQSYGIALIFSRKNGFELNNLQKLLFLLPLYLAYLYPIVRLNSVLGTPTDLWGVAIPTLGLPAWVPNLFGVAFYTSFIAYMLFTFYIHHTQNKWLPGIVQVVVFSHILWFCEGSMMAGFMNFVPFFHCLQYLLITTYFHFRENRTKSDSGTAFNYLKSRRFAVYYLLLLMLGGVLFIAVPHALSWGGISSFALASAIVVSFLNMHHFVLDGAIWKLRRPEIGQALTG